MNVLDVGSAYAPFVYHRLLCRLPAQEIHSVDLVPIDLPRVTGHVADARSLSFPDNTFDVAVCISTLEHIGLDNTLYNGSRELDLDGDTVALRELGRVTAGRVIVTVPGGTDERYDGFRQYSPARWAELIAAAGLEPEATDYFAHDLGWQSVDASVLAGRRYGERARFAAAVICSSLRVG